MKKEKIEKYALASVFDYITLANVQHLNNGDDPPDFIINIEKDFNIGVEITTHYRDGSNARLYNIPNYMKSLFDGTSKRKHKDDIENLAVKKVTIQDPNGNIKQTDVPGIMRETEPLIDYIDSLTELIKTKNVKILKSTHTLERKNLIILDVERRVDSLERKDVPLIVFDEKIRETVRQSPFDEIYLITGMKSTDKDVVIPIKLNLFYQDVELLLYTVNADFKRIRSMKTFASLILYLFDYLKESAVIVNMEDKKLTLFKNQFTIVFDEADQKKGIVDYGSVKNPSLVPQKFGKYNDSDSIIKRWQHYRKTLMVDNFISYESKEVKKK